MATSRASKSSILQGFPKSRSMLAGNTAYQPPDWAFNSIATVTVGSGGASSATFSSIPSTYSHLQIRALVRGTRAATYDSFFVRFNGDTGSNYTQFQLEGSGSAVAASGSEAGGQNAAWLGYLPASTNTANVFGSSVVDIVDYKSTSKYKTVRTLAGSDNNGGGYIVLYSNVWLSTSAINSITITGQNANLAQYSSFALYGIK